MGAAGKWGAPRILRPPERGAPGILRPPERGA